jgi:hypothetical protein
VNPEDGGDKFPRNAGNHLQIDGVTTMKTTNKYVFFVFGGLVVSVLAIGPKFRGFKPGRGPYKSAVLLPSEGN